MRILDTDHGCTGLYYVDGKKREMLFCPAQPREIGYSLSGGSFYKSPQCRTDCAWFSLNLMAREKKEYNQAYCKDSLIGYVKIGNNLK